MYIYIIIYIYIISNTIPIGLHQTSTIQLFHGAAGTRSFNPFAAVTVVPTYGRHSERTLLLLLLMLMPWIDAP